MINVTQYLADQFNLPYITAQFLLVDWEITEYRDFSVITQGSEVHFLLKTKSITRPMFRDVLGPLIHRYGRATTRCPLGAVENIYFVERIGFRRVGADAHFIHFEIDNVPFQNRRPPCPSSYH